MLSSTPGGSAMILRWSIRVLVALATLVVVVGGAVYALSERHLRSFRPPPPFRLTLSSNPQVLARGHHIAQTRGCIGCHGQRLEGEVFEDAGINGRFVAPSLTHLARRETPATLEAAIRHGIAHDGRAVWAMPSYNFAHLTDDDLSALILYLRAAPNRPAALPREWIGPHIRFRMAVGSDAAIPAFVPQVPPLRWQQNADPRVRRGEYLAMTSCNECHGFGLRGDSPFDPPDRRPPDLAIAAAYDRDHFGRLMRTGVPMDGRKLDHLMVVVATGRFVHWTEAEVDDLYAFFRALGGRPMTRSEPSANR